MRDMGGEFDEFETTEDEIDAMMAVGEPVQVDVPDEQKYISSLYVVASVPLTVGGSTMMPNVGNAQPPSVQIAMPVSQFAETAA